MATKRTWSLKKIVCCLLTYTRNAKLILFFCQHEISMASVVGWWRQRHITGVRRLCTHGRRHVGLATYTAKLVMVAPQQPRSASSFATAQRAHQVKLLVVQARGHAGIELNDLVPPYVIRVCRCPSSFHARAGGGGNKTRPLQRLTPGNRHGGVFRLPPAAAVAY